MILSGKYDAVVILIMIASVLGGCRSGTANQTEKTSRPNIIVMYSDDHTAQAIGAYRESLDYGLKLDHTPTPNIDRLAEKGMRFDNAFVTNSICKPSRAVLLTGTHNHKNKVWTNRESIDINLQTFPSLLQQAGYQTAVIGKWHLGSEPQGFDYYEVLHGQGPYYNPTMRTKAGDVHRQGHTSGIITNRALSWLKQRDYDKPFLMMYNHKAPHRNWLPGPRHLHDYQDRDLPEPSSLFYDYSGLASPAKKQEMEIGNHLTWGWDLKVPKNPETGEVGGGWNNLVNRNKLTEEQLELIKKAYEAENQELYESWDQMSDKEKRRWKYQRYIKDYLRVIRGVDDGVGRMLDYLKREKLYDNTVIIYAGDQGFFLGENGWFDKRWIYEESMRMPLIVHWPEGIDEGITSDHLVQNLDLAPTILDMAEIQIPAMMQGKSLLPILQGENVAGWRNAVYYHYYEGPPRVHHVAKHYGIRTDRYTLAHYYEQDEWELFDLKEDPEQLQSVYDDSEYSDVQKRLRKKVDELQEKYEVEFMPEDNE